MKRIVVTGGAGQIAYSLLFRIAAGDIFGKETPIALHLLDLKEFVPVLEGVRMELDDCAFPLLKEIHVGSDPFKLFADVDLALLVGAKPRGPGMERKDLLFENGKIFIEQGKALDQVAKKDVKVFVVGNPCNTNCWITMKNAPSLSPKNFHAMTRLDENRGRSLLARKAGVPISEVSSLTIWGNHSSTQVPDYTSVKIAGKKALDKIGDQSWLQGAFIQEVQKRGAAVIAARGKSSAASAANALIDAVKEIYTKTPDGAWFSSSVFSKGNPYGIEEDLIFSFPCRSKGQGDYEIVTSFSIDPFIREKIKQTEKELIEEREMIHHEPSFI